MSYSNIFFISDLQAEKKGATATEYGLVFGIFELIVFLISPLYGQYLNQIGPRALFNGGIFTTGASAIVFGLLDKVEVSIIIRALVPLRKTLIDILLKQGHTAFITLAFAVRIIEALGNAAFLTASFAIIAKEFPNNVSTTFVSIFCFV